jgi:hypothetical protein
MTMSNEETRSFLNQINSAYPPARLQPTEIVGVYSGMLPWDPDSLLTNDVQLEKHYAVIDHEREHGIPGVMTLVGVKWTRARLVAFETVDRITRRLGRGPDGPCAAPPSLAGSPGKNLAGFLEAGIESAVLRRTEFGTTLELDEDTWQRCADLVGRNMGWPESTVSRERDRTRKTLAGFKLRE